MGALMRATDWSKTPVGPVRGWPQSLRTAVSILMESRFPMYIAWGPDYTQFYNDGYRPILGSTKHPAALGRRACETFAESWHIIGPMFDGVMAGQAVGSEDWMLPLDRHGYLEECYFTFSYSPIRAEDGVVGGVHVTVTETTARVLHERRLSTLRDLAAHAANAKSEPEAWRGALQALAPNAADIPFAVAFAFDRDGAATTLLGSTLDHAAAEGATPLDLSDLHAGWPLESLVQSARDSIVVEVPARFGRQLSRTWPEPVTTAVVLPIARPGLAMPYGALVAGISPRRALDDAYRDFLQLVADHLGTAVANSRAYAEERRRAEALAELDRAKTAFFSNISHEFRTPLTLMIGPQEDALAVPGGVLGGESLRAVHRNTLRLLKLVNSLLDFARIEAGRAEASYEPTDLAALTSELASTFRSAIERAGLRLDVDCPPLAEPIHVDRDMWEKIVLNLLSNAFKFTFDGEIRVALHPAAGGVALTVADTGVGIASEELPRVFERFRRIEGTRSRTHEGSGIGLALVKDLVRLHGGEIEVASQPGRGTTFRVTIPAGTAHLPPDRISAGRALARTLHSESYVAEAMRWLPTFSDEPASAPGGRAPVPPDQAPAARIVLADDNADLRDYVSRLLRQEGWAVEAVPDGVQALAAVTAERPDVILADVMMPNLDGFGLLAAVRADARTSMIPFIMLSARAGEESRVEGLAAGADDYLVKPFSARELVARVTTHLQLSRLRAEAGEAGTRLRDLLMQSPVAISVVTGPEHRYELANPRYLEMVNRQALVGKTVAEAFPEVVGTPLMEIFDRVFRTGEPFATDEYRTALHRGGSIEECFFTFNLVPTRNASGAVTGMMCTAVELTQQVRARRAAEGAHKLLEAVVKQMPAGVIVAEAPTGRTLLANPAVERILGRRLPQGGSFETDRNDIAFYPDGRRFEPDDYPLVRALAGEVTLEQEMAIMAGDGSRRVVLASAAPVFNATGQLVAAVAAFSDITERKDAETQRRELLGETQRARAEAEAANRAKDEFLAMLGHELRNPLAPMLTALHLMRLRESIGVEKERTVIERQAQHLVRLVDDLLDVSRVTRSKIELKIERVELAEVMAKAIELASPVLEQRDHTLTLDVDRGLVLDADPARLAQVMSNLVVNAAKYSEGRGQIAISGTLDDGQVVIRVRDNGIGIDREMLPRIFDLFIQEQQALDRSQGGLGLGLTIVRSLVELHGGRVEARSAGRNRGSEFIVSLPQVHDNRSRAAEAAEMVLAAHRPGGVPRSILVVDDNEDAAEMLAAALEAHGHMARVAHDGPQALTIAAGFRPDVALLDLGLPVMDGYELARLLRDTEGLRRLRLVAVTGYGQDRDRQRSQDAGFDAHLVKPINLDELQSVIDDLLGDVPGAGGPSQHDSPASPSSEARG